MRVKNRKKEVSIAILILVVIILSIGYGYLSTTLGIDGISRITSNQWEIHFANVEETAGSVQATTKATINKDLDTINFDITFNNIGEYYDFTFDVVNGGTIDASLTELIKKGISEEQAPYIDFAVTYADGKEINIDDKLPAGESRKVRVKVSYHSDIFNGEINAQDKLLYLSFKMNYIQDKI